jgi:hypothetical protein
MRYNRLCQGRMGEHRPPAVGNQTMLLTMLLTLFEKHAVMPTTARRYLSLKQAKRWLKTTEGSSDHSTHNTNLSTGAVATVLTSTWPSYVPAAL